MMMSGGVSSSAAIIGGNDYLLTEILVLLPTKSVVRFKSVSRDWLSLISGESFASLHVRRRHGVDAEHSFVLSQFLGTSQIYTCDPTLKKLFRFSLPDPIKRHLFDYVQIVHSINGLLLLAMRIKKHELLKYCIFNPTTKGYRFINLDAYRQPCGMFLLYDPSQSQYYKIFMATCAYPSFYSLYDSATHQWSNISGEMRYHELGFIWSRSMNNNFTASLSKRGFRVNTLPDYPQHQSYSSSVFESNGYMNLLQCKLLLSEGRNNKCCFRVANVLPDRSSWAICKEATIDFGSQDMVMCLGMIRKHRIEDSAFLFHVPGQLLIYRFSDDDDDQRLEVLADYTSDYFYAEGQFQFDSALPFIHTLASV